MGGFGEKMRRLRQARGITQKALAAAAGLTASYYNRMEKGTRKIPRVETVLGLITALHAKVRLSLQEAEELVQLAGYSPEVLQFGGRLAYDSPTTSGADALPEGLVADLTGLHAALANIPRRRQQPCIDALTTLIENLSPMKGERPTAGEENRHE